MSRNLAKMSRHNPKQLTQLLAAWTSGEPDALDRLMPAVYAELKRIARARLRGESPGHSLQSVDLVNEAYLRLVDQRNVRWQNRAHFFGIAAELMRRILVDRARKRHAAKRGGGAQVMVFDDAVDSPTGPEIDLLALDSALRQLEKVDSRKSRIVELRFFGGLTVKETAEVMGLSPSAVSREWTLAKSRLYQHLKRES